ncbi:hypothetical protein [Streptomyces sp. NPDC005209]|uniref:hypothetical protein n=1 Tax=Streptomyces sp. NPDC005209 TaxID=3156715 RepID=UPI0033BB4E8F
MVRQWLGRYGKTDNGIVTVTTVWTDGRVYFPLHATPYTPALTAGLIAWQQSRTSDQQRHNAEAARRVAVSRQLAARSATLIGTNPDLASLPEPHPFHPAATTGNPGPSQTCASPPLPHSRPDDTVTGLLTNDRQHSPHHILLTSTAAHLGCGHGGRAVGLAAGVEAQNTPTARAQGHNEADARDRMNRPPPAARAQPAPTAPAPPPAHSAEAAPTHNTHEGAPIPQRSTTPRPPLLHFLPGPRRCRGAKGDVGLPTTAQRGGELQIHRQARRGGGQFSAGVPWSGARVPAASGQLARRLRLPSAGRTPKRTGVSGRR